MTNRRRSQAQARHTREGRALSAALRLVPRSVVSAAGQSVSGVRSNFLRYIDFHPALALLTGVAIIALVCVIYLGQVNAAANANYSLQALQSEHDRLVLEQENLQLAIGQAQSLPNIEKVARDKLKMVPLGTAYVYLPVPSGPLAAMPSLPTPAPATPTPQQ